MLAHAAACSHLSLSGRPLHRFSTNTFPPVLTALVPARLPPRASPGPAAAVAVARMQRRRVPSTPGPCAVPVPCCPSSAHREEPLPVPATPSLGTDFWSQTVWGFLHGDHSLSFCWLTHPPPANTHAETWVRCRFVAGRRWVSAPRPLGHVCPCPEPLPRLSPPGPRSLLANWAPLKFSRINN